MFYAFVTGSFERHKSWVYSVDYISPGTIISASENELLLWDKRQCTNRLTGHTDAIKSVAISPNKELFVSGSVDKAIKVWSIDKKCVLKTLHGHSEGVNKVAFDGSNKYVISAGYDNKLIVWDWRTGDALKKFDIKHTYFSINEHNILAYVDSTCDLKLFDLNSQLSISTLGSYCGAPVFNPRGNVLAIYNLDKHLFTFIDITKNKVLSVLNIKKYNDKREVSVFKFTPDGQCLVAGIWGGDIEIWDWQRKRLVKSIENSIVSSVEDLVIDNDQVVSASGDRSVKVWNWKNGNLQMVLGNGQYQAKLNSILAVAVLVSLLISFWGISWDANLKFSNRAIMLVLSGWTFGLFLIVYFLRSYLERFSIFLIWTITGVSGLFFYTVFASWLTIYTIPVALSLIYIQLITNKRNYNVYIPLVINLMFCVTLCWMFKEMIR
ncbi:WD40 repeat domain-containing protein [Mucilaginibacter litoreus]|uniref:WD40 repeat domain-containing protein n=2 Tax=Mucilaginibacter litoreus TaxID=1048221 RepID=A0ABW3AV14_9SPHI